MARRRFTFRRIRRASHVVRRRAHRSMRVISTLGSRIRSVTGRIGGSFPAALKPSRVTAYTGLAVGTATLVFTPLSDGDSWLKRLSGSVIPALKAQDYSNILAYDSEGNGIVEVAVAQLKQNAPAAVLTMGAYGAVAGFLRWVGM